MTGKEKRQLRALASTMPAVVTIGKDGLTDSVIDSARAAITARELIKVHILNNSGLDTKETIEELADMLCVELIQIIGHFGVIFKKKKEKSRYEFIQ